VTRARAVGRAVALSCAVALAGPSLAAAAAPNQEVAAERATEPETFDRAGAARKVEPFVRSRARDGLAAFDTATRFYRRADGTGPAVALVGVVHIGDKAYYDALVGVLDDHEIVLYESVLPRGAFGTNGADDRARQIRTQEAMLFLRGLIEGFVAANGRVPASAEELRDFVVERDSRLARPFALAFVDGWGRALDFAALGAESGREGGDFRLSSLGRDGRAGGRDLDLDLVLSRLPERAPDAGPSDAPARRKDGRDLYGELAGALGVALQVRSIDYDRAGWEPADLPLEELLDRLWKRGERSAALEMLSADGGFAQGALRFLLSIVSNSPSFKRMVIQTLGQAGEGSSAGLGEVDRRLILDERNDAVIEHLRELLARADAPRSVAIFYGAAHMADFEVTLGREFGLVPVETRWDTAMSVDEWSASRLRSAIALLERRLAERRGEEVGEELGDEDATRRARAETRLEELRERLARKTEVAPSQ
jgi:hypothetical protein